MNGNIRENERTLADGNVVIGVGDYAVCNIPGGTIKTFALGSCVSVIMQDLKCSMVGMVHVALPESAISLEKAAEHPGYFADTGIPALIDLMGRMGSRKRGKGMVVKLAGGAQIMDSSNTFNIGKRNALAVKETLWANGIGSVAEDLGGQISRTVTVDVDSGNIIISTPGRESWKI
tara:strand:+ start:13463 stop:13990 length:528 start_codon:yes stop_codon:yes gene_type:complete